jgi:hypothetical protein
MSTDFLLPVSDDDVDVFWFGDLTGVLDDALKDALLAKFLEDERVAVGGNGIFSCGEDDYFEFGMF